MIYSLSKEFKAIHSGFILHVVLILFFFTYWLDFIFYVLVIFYFSLTIRITSILYLSYILSYKNLKISLSAFHLLHCHETISFMHPPYYCPYIGMRIYPKNPQPIPPIQTRCVSTRNRRNVISFFTLEFSRTSWTIPSRDHTPPIPKRNLPQKNNINHSPQ